MTIKEEHKIPNKDSLVKLINEEVLPLTPFLVNVGISVNGKQSGRYYPKRFHLYYRSNGEGDVRGILESTEKENAKEILNYIRVHIPTGWNVIEIGKTDIPYSEPMEYLQIVPNGATLEESLERLTT